MWLRITMAMPWISCSGTPSAVAAIIAAAVVAAAEWACCGVTVAVFRSTIIDGTAAVVRSKQRDILITINTTASDMVPNLLKT